MICSTYKYIEIACKDHKSSLVIEKIFFMRCDNVTTITIL